MDGTEHYREAERKIRVADNLRGESAANIYASAQVHATLALAAATAVCSPAMFRDGPPDQDLVAWQEVAGGVDEPVSSEPGQVGPEPFVLPFITEVEPGTVVRCPDLAFGEPVTIEVVGAPYGQFPKVHVVFRRDPNSQIRDSVDLPADTVVTPADPEPAARVRLADLAEQVDSGAVLYVTHADWNDGEPVLLHLVTTDGDDVPEGRIGVRYSFVDDAGDDEYVTEHVSAAALVAPLPTA